MPQCAVWCSIWTELWQIPRRICWRRRMPVCCRGRCWGRRTRLTAFHGGRAMLRLGFERLGMDWIGGGCGCGLSACCWRPTGRAIATHTRLYPGAMEAVEALRAAGLCGVDLHQQARGAGGASADRAWGAGGRSGRWSGRIRCRCASPTRRPIGRRWSGRGAWWRGRCWWAIPRPTRRPGWRRGCRWRW